MQYYTTGCGIAVNTNSIPPAALAHLEAPCQTRELQHDLLCEVGSATQAIDMFWNAVTSRLAVIRSYVHMGIRSCVLYVTNSLYQRFFYACRSRLL